MAALRLRFQRVTATALVLGSAVLSGSAMQTPTSQRDALQFENAKPALLLFSVNEGNAVDFEKFWTEMQTALNRSEVPEVKAFAATFGQLTKVDAVSASPGAPVQYLVQLPSPSTTQSYNPGRILYEFLFRQQRISRAQADGMMAKLQNIKFVDIAAFQSTR